MDVYCGEIVDEFFLVNGVEKNIVFIGFDGVL